MLSKPNTCKGCPAEHLGKGYVPAATTSGASGMVAVGQGPGEVEAYQGIPFSGPTGQKLDRWFIKAGIHREKVHIDNIVRCWLPGNRPPTAAEADHCTRVHLMPELLALDGVRVVVPVGVPAARYFLGPEFGETAAGTISWLELGNGPKESTETS